MYNDFSIFDIVGPVLIGPSSSHTAGACRLANAAKAIFSKPIDEVAIYVYGSFSQTLFGHGTNKALVGGLLGISPCDEKLTSSLEIAKEEGLKYSFLMDDSTLSSENIVRFEIVGVNGDKMTICGASIGGGSIIINKINEIDLHISLKYGTLVINFVDKPGAVNSVSSILAQRNINIASINLYRKAKHSSAYMIIELDQDLYKETLDCLRAIEGALVIYLKKLY